MNASEPVTVGVVYQGRGTGHTIAQAVDSLGHDARRLTAHQLGFEADETGVALRDDTLDVLVNWRPADRDGTSLAAHELLRAAADAVPVVNPPAGVVAASSKLSSTTRLRAAGLPVPRTVYSPSFRQTATARTEFDAVVQKPIFGGAGTDVVKRAVDEPAQMLPGPQPGLLQAPIETPGDTHWDVRAFVVDGEVITTMRRQAPPNNWRTNIAQGGEGDAYDLPAEAAQLAVDATDVLDLDAAGVDLLQSADGQWYILEVNAPAGVKGITAATGINPAVHIAAVAIRNGGGQVAADRVDALASQLGYVDTSQEWRVRGEPVQPPFRMRVEQDGACQLVGQTTRTVSATVDTERLHSLVRASAVADLGVSVVDVEKTTIGDDTQTRPLVRVKLAKGEIVRTITACLVEDENEALTADVVLATG